MYKVPSKSRKHITAELKKFLPLVKNLQAKGKSSTEDDARIIINDMLSDVLGYDKYNELRTEFKDRNGRIDYAVKLSEGPNAKRKDRLDFIVEAKAAHVSLNTNHVDQALGYCLTKGINFFVVTNSAKWELYAVKNSKKNPGAILIHEVNFGTSNSPDNLAEEFYLFSKAAYLNKDWEGVKSHQNATKVEDIAAILLSEKVLKSVVKQLSVNSNVKISLEVVKDIVENQIIKNDVEKINKKLTKKINSSKKVVRSSTQVKKNDEGSNVLEFPAQTEQTDPKEEAS